MAAAIPKTTALASAKAQMTLLPEMTSLPAALSLSVHGKAGLPRFSGLRIQHQSKRSLGLALLDSKRGYWFSRREGEGKGIVCESRETALDGAGHAGGTWDSWASSAGAASPTAVPTGIRVLARFQGAWQGTDLKGQSLH